MNDVDVGEGLGRIGRGRRMVAGAVAAVVFAMLGWVGTTSPAAAPAETYEGLDTFTNILSIVQKNYVDEVQTGKLVEGAITGMLTSLDPHSAYLTADDYKDLQVETKGSFGGLGIEITNRNGVLTIVAPIEDTPAHRAGLKSADVIVKIDGQITKDLSIEDAVKRMRGAPDTKVVLTIKRENPGKLFDVTITREIIKIQSVKSRVLERGYGYLRLTQFQERTDSDLERSLRTMQKDSGGLLGAVLDLRNNPGGLLTQAVNVADLFLESGLIVYTDGRLEAQKHKYFARKAGSWTDFPMVVLVNGGSASASEIVAGALQDQKRALVLGTTTFGKGSVQTILPLEDAAALRLTTARYFTPSGRSIQATGIVPDILMEQNPALAKTDNPSSVRESDLPGHLANPEPGKPNGAEPAGQDAPAAPGDGASGEGGEKPIEVSSIREGELGADPQLDRALELLKSWQVFKSFAVRREG